MSTTTATATPTSTCHPKLYDIPVRDAACAMSMQGNNSAIMASCCSGADVVSYSNCDYYCLAQGQNVGSLAECLIKASEPGEVWCNTNASATATGSVPTTGAGTIVATATVSGTGTKSAAGTGTGTGTSGAERVGGKKAVGVVLMLGLGVLGGML
ncbi:hypothetical protein BDV25DRAFT_171318 [Aspergillus avenaceus]|uniref:Uncharacterized protein n=1 Tax=Aspergillus avenaceus TaxID=36643 RepID=A0A5N6TE26_ASPAV|nr:hypothetical protein BDV25DRAFT_171318 [Aspergillus avenaceus]